MRRTFAAVACAFALAAAAMGQETQAQEAAQEAAPGAAPGAWRFGLMGTIEMGGMSVRGSGFDRIEENGYGTISGDSVVALFSGGCFFRKPEIVDVAFLFSYLAGGSFVWDGILGIQGSSFSLYGDSLAAQVEFHPLFPFLNGIRPFAGAGYSLTNGLVDEIGDGFVSGTGPFALAGLDVVSWFGKPNALFSDDGKGFAALRLSLYYRIPYEYDFKLGWNEFSSNYSGAAPIDDLKDFFSGSFPAESIAFGIGLSIGFSPWVLGGKAGAR
ncbi:MAG TPA: hypothetical protein DIC34_07430 [Treponema sp.]|nr:hypothetical protein [Treponema sp.]